MNTRFVVDLRRKHEAAVTGKERYAEGLLHGLSELGCRPLATVAAPMDLRPALTASIGGDYDVVQLPPSPPRYHASLARLLRREDSARLVSALSFLPALYSPRTATIVYDHAAWEGMAPTPKVFALERIFRPPALRRSVVLVISRHTLEGLPHPGQSRVLPVPLLPNWHTREPRSYGPRSGLLVVGTLNRRKRVDVAIRMMARLPADERMVVVGADGGERGRLEDVARSIGVADRVEFAGPVSEDDLRRHYDAARVLLNTSEYEGLSFPILEAGARGLPVLSTPVGIAPETVAPEYLVAVNDDSQLAKQALVLLREEDAWKTASENGRRRTAGMTSLKAAEALVEAVGA